MRSRPWPRAPAPTPRSRQWWADRCDEDDDAAIQAEEGRLQAATDAQERFGAEIAGAVGDFAAKHQAEIDAASPRFAELLEAGGISDVVSGEHAKQIMEMALRGVRESDRVNAINSSPEVQAIDQLLELEYGYHGEEVPEHGPVVEPELQRLAPKPSREERMTAFDRAFDEATKSGAEELWESLQREGARAAALADGVEQKTGRRPR